MISASEFPMEPNATLFVTFTDHIYRLRCWEKKSFQSQTVLTTDHLLSPSNQHKRRETNVCHKHWLPWIKVLITAYGHMIHGTNQRLTATDLWLVTAGDQARDFADTCC